MNYVVIIMDTSVNVPSCLGVWDSAHQSNAYDFLKKTLKQCDIYDEEYQSEIDECVNIHELAAVAERYYTRIRVYINTLNDERTVYPI